MRRYLFIILSIVPLFFGGILLYQIYDQVFKKTLDQLVQLQRLYAEQAASGIESFFAHSKSALNHLAQHDSIIDMNGDMLNELKKFYESYANEIKAITRVDKNGIINFTIPFNDEVIGRDISYQPHNALIMETHEPVISDVFNTVQGYRAIAFAYPVFKNEEYNGCISLLIPFELIAKRFLENIRIGESGYAYVLSEKGIELFSPIEGRTGLSVFETPEQYPTVFNLVQKMLKKESGIGEYYYHPPESKSKVAIEKIAAYHPVELENTFWSVAVTMAIDEALHANDSFVNYFLLIVFISGFTFFMFVFGYFRTKINAEKKLREEEEKYKIATEQTGQMIYEYHVGTGEIKWFGAIEEVVGYSPEEFKSFDLNKWVDNIHQDDRESLRELLNESEKNLSKFQAEYRFKDKAGDYVYIDDNGVYSCLDKTPICLIGTMKNITARKLAEKELSEHKVKLEKQVKERTKELLEANAKLEKDIQIRKNTEKELLLAKGAAEYSDKLKSEFLAQMSHEIRTPINTMMSFASLLRDEIGEKVNEDLKLSFTVISNAGKRIIRTIDLLLNMSEIQIGSLVINPIKLNLYKDVLENLKLEYYNYAKEKGLEFEIICGDPNFIITGDQYTLVQMFSNLIDNAIKYTPEGKISVVCKIIDNKKVVKIIDTGIGISENYLPHLFDSFSQEDQGYTRKFEGTGLGLALVKKYCELNNAEISVESKKGEGSTFKIIFK